MKQIGWYLSLIACVAISGCDSKAPSDAIQKSLPDASKKAASLTPDVPKVEPTEQDKDATMEAEPAKDLGGLPKDLITDAYHWYGLENKKPVDLELRRSSDNTVFSGSILSKFTGMDGVDAVFALQRTGSLKDELGDEEVVLKKDGIYVRSNTKGKLSKESLDLPTDLTPGKTWKVDSGLTTSSEEIKQNLTAKIVGVRPLKLPTGTVQALLVQEDGTWSVGDGKPAKVTNKSWFVKGIGAVRTVTVVTQTGKKAVSLTMERITKRGKK